MKNLRYVLLSLRFDVGYLPVDKLPEMNGTFHELSGCVLFTLQC